MIWWIKLWMINALPLEGGDARSAAEEAFGRLAYRFSAARPA